jgi:hypothetical protein
MRDSIDSSLESGIRSNSMQAEGEKVHDAARVTWNVIARARPELNRIARLFAALILASAFAHPAAAQNYLTSTGSPSFSAPEPVELGFVDASNGNLHLSIPLGSYPQRGNGQAQPITLEYDSNIWAPFDDGLTVQWSPGNSPMFVDWNGWYFSFKAGEQTSGGVASQGCYVDEPWTDPNGTAHIFHIEDANTSGCPTSADAFASDSSGYHMYWVSGSYAGLAARGVSGEFPAQC